jgi:hypothetical protein
MSQNKFNIKRIEIPIIILDWSAWYAWSKFHLDARLDSEGVTPPDASGVYEARLIDTSERLTIGRTSNLRIRVKQGLVKGKVPHSSGKDIRTKEDISRIVIRWAVTDSPAAAEEELHKRYREFFGTLPKYTDRT